MLFFILNAFIPSVKIDFATCIQSGHQLSNLKIYSKHGLSMS